MKNNQSKNMSNLLRLLPIIGLLLLAFAAFAWRGAAAEKKLTSDLDSFNQPNTLGKLAFAQTVFTSGLCCLEI